MKVKEAVRTHFKAQRDEAVVRYMLYTEHPLAVGDHANVVEEAIKALQDYEHANSCLDTLESL